MCQTATVHTGGEEQLGGEQRRRGTTSWTPQRSRNHPTTDAVHSLGPSSPTTTALRPEFTAPPSSRKDDRPNQTPAHTVEPSSAATSTNTYGVRQVRQEGHGGGQQHSHRRRRAAARRGTLGCRQPVPIGPAGRGAATVGYVEASATLFNLAKQQKQQEERV